MRFLIHDRDTKFSAALDSTFVWEGIAIVLTPVHAPQANAMADAGYGPFVRSVGITCSF